MTRPNCLRCGYPVATPDDWRDIPEGEGDDLCWSTKGAVCEKRLPVVTSCGRCYYSGWNDQDQNLVCKHDEGDGELTDPKQAPPSWCPLRGPS